MVNKSQVKVLDSSRHPFIDDEVPEPRIDENDEEGSQGSEVTEVEAN